MDHSTARSTDAGEGIGPAVVEAERQAVRAAITQRDVARLRAKSVRPRAKPAKFRWLPIRRHSARSRYAADASLEFRVVSMSDEVTYGPRAYTQTFAEAVAQGIICDYRVVVSVVDPVRTPSGKT